MEHAATNSELEALYHVNLNRCYIIIGWSTVSIDFTKF